MLTNYFENFCESQSLSPSQTKVEFGEEQRLEAFEEGYKAGWEDAVKAKSDEDSTLGEQLKSQLLDMSFTYHEAVRYSSKQASDLLQVVIEKVIPGVARAKLQEEIMQILESALSNSFNSKVEIRVSEENVTLVENLLSGDEGLQVNIVSDASKDAHSATLHLGDEELSVDTSRVAEEIETLVANFWTEIAQDQRRAG